MSSSSIVSDFDVSNVSPQEQEARRSSGSYLAESIAWCALTLLCVLSLWMPCDTAVVIGLGESIWHIGLSLLAFYFAALCASSLGQVRAWPRMSLVWLLIAMVVLWHVLATSYSLGRTNLKNSIYGFWQSTAMWLLLPTMVWLVRTPQAAARVLKLWWILAVFALLWGFWEYGVTQPLQRADLAKDRIGYLQRYQIDPDSSQAVLIVNRIQSTEVLSLFALANSYAGFLVALWPICLGWMLLSFKQRRSLGWIPLVLVLAVGLSLLLTKSRTAWVATAISTCLAMILDPILRRELGRWIRNHRMILAGILIGLLAIFGAVYALDPLIFQEAGKSLAYRMDYWNGALELIAQQPLYGYGSLNFQPTYLQVKKITAAETPADPHNFILELAHSGGWILVGLTALLVLMLCLWGFRHRVFAKGSLDDPFSRPPCQEDRSKSRLVWITLIASALGVFVYAFLRIPSDLEVIGTSASLIIAGLFGYWLSRPQVSTSVQSFVANHPVLLLVSFLGVMIHFLASGGWMLPGTMIAPMIAMGLWLAGNSWREQPEPTNKTPRPSSWQAPLVATAILGLWGLSMAWPYLQAQRITSAFSKDAQGRLLIDGAIADKVFPNGNDIQNAIASVPHDPELARWGLELGATALDSKLPPDKKISWLTEFRQAGRQLVQRDPNHSVAYAEAGSQLLRASVGQRLDSSLNDEMTARRVPIGEILTRPASRARGQGRGAGAAVRPSGSAGPLTVSSALLQESLYYYQEAAKFAPSSAELHLQTAAVAAMQGNWRVCESMLDQAEEIDRQTPHLDRKIEASKIWIPREMVKVIEQRAKAGGKISGDSSPSLDKLKLLLDRSESVPGEPVRQALRSFFKNP